MDGVYEFQTLISFYSDQYGFDRQAFEDLVNEGGELRRAIKKIAADYSTTWSE